MSTRAARLVGALLLAGLAFALATRMPHIGPLQKHGGPQQLQAVWASITCGLLLAFSLKMASGALFHREVPRCARCRALLEPHLPRCPSCDAPVTK